MIKMNVIENCFIMNVHHDCIRNAKIHTSVSCS